MSQDAVGPSDASRIADVSDDVRAYPRTLSNWGRWGADDELGTLNLISPEKRIRAASLVREGLSVSLARKITAAESPDQIAGPFSHQMHSSGEGFAAVEDYNGAPQVTTDAYSLAYHGFHFTHLDALCHIFWNGQMYNGRPSSLVTLEKGAAACDVDAASAGVFTRGVLLDLPRSRGIPWLEPGEAALPSDLEQAEEWAGVRIEEGDALLIRTGHEARTRELGAWSFAQGYAGLDPTCLPWLRELGVALLGCDSASDTGRSPYPDLPLPIHQIAIPAMGLWLLDNASVDELAELASNRKRWTFLFVLSPLRVEGGTGSPVNPIAVL